MKLDGYVIVPPLNPWDEEYHDLIITHSSYRTFGRTATEAWMRFIGFQHFQTDIDRPIIIQKWHDKGYRVKKATLEIHDEDS